MALQLWLPLTKDTRQQGLSDIKVTGSPASWGDGKLGKCATWNGAVANVLYNNTTDFNYTDNFSVAFWANPVYTGSTAQYAWTVGRADAGGYGYGFQIISATTAQFRFGNGSYGVSAPSNEWHHFVMTIGNSKVTIYKDGIQVGSNNLPGTIPTYSDGNGMGLGCFHYSGNIYPFYGSLNDFRIYDHVLSQMEVKELAKGLILHYPLSNKNIESTTNLVTGITSGGQTTWANNILTTSGTNADTYFTINLSENIVNGTQYTISCDAENIPSGTCWTFPLGQQSNTTLLFQIYNGHNEYTFTANNISWGTNRCFMDDGGSPNSARYTGVQCKLYNFQIEKKDHATGFAGYGKTRTPNIEYDCSGYCNNGNITGTLNCNYDTPKYDISTTFPNNCNTWIANTDFPQIAKNLTFACWCKIQQGANSSFSFIVSQGRDNTKSGFNIILNGTEYALHGSFGSLKSGVNVDNTWKHIVGTYDGATIKIYINGQLKNSMNYTSDLTYTYAPALVIGKMAYGYTSTANYFPTNGSISDVRIYATALSAEDVKSLYQNEAYIDSSGTIYGQIR